MTAAFDAAIETLSPHHNRSGFSCGDSALDEYLRRFANQHAKTGVSRTYVASEGSTILGFYSLAMSAISKDQLPLKYQSRLPNFSLPVARLARLAVDQRYQGRGLGELLLADALCRCLRLSEEIGMIGIIVDAKNKHARAYYERYEFEHFPDSPLTLWLPVAAIARLQ